MRLGVIPTRLSGIATGHDYIAVSPILAEMVITIVPAGKGLFIDSPISFKVWLCPLIFPVDLTTSPVWMKGMSPSLKSRFIAWPVRKFAAYHLRHIPQASPPPSPPGWCWGRGRCAIRCAGPGGREDSGSWPRLPAAVITPSRPGGRGCRPSSGYARLTSPGGGRGCAVAWRR